MSRRRHFGRLRQIRLQNSAGWHRGGSDSGIGMCGTIVEQVGHSFHGGLSGIGLLGCDGSDGF